MAERGTPLIAVADGIITRKVNDPEWTGLGLAIADGVGTRYSYAHLDSFAPGMEVGRRVKMGDVIGYVGNTGDAAGGPTHLHFEVHPYGGAAVPPKPYVDAWLDAAEKRAVAMVKKATGKLVTNDDLNLGLWNSRLLQLAQHEIQASNLLAARNRATSLKRKPAGADQQTLPYALPIILIALLGAALLALDRRRMPVGPARRREEETYEQVPLLQATAIEIALALALDVEGAFANTDVDLEPEGGPGEGSVSRLAASPDRI